MAVPPPSKKVLRGDLKIRRRDYVTSLTVAERCMAAILLREHALPHVGNAQAVALYLPIGSEIDPLPLLETLEARGIATALPHVTGRSDTPRFLAWSPGEALVAGPLGLRQPDETARSIDPDLIFAPLLGFDGARNRIGYGAGHYDRAFVRWPNAQRVGLAWDIQRVDRVPADHWDVPLHAIITEKESYS